MFLFGRSGVDWEKIRDEYIAGGISCRELAEKYGVGRHAVQSRATRGKWNQARNAVDETKTKIVVEKISAQKAEGIADDLSVARYPAQIWQDTLQQVASLMGTEGYVEYLAKRPDRAAHMSEAIRTNIESLIKVHRILSAAEEKRLDIEERKLQLEREKFQASQEAEKNGAEAIEVILHLPEGVSVG